MVAHTPSSTLPADGTPAGLLEGLFEAAPLGLGVLDAELRYVRRNARLAALHPVLGDRVEALSRQVRATGAPVLDVEVSGAPPGTQDRPRHWNLSVFPLEGGNGLGVTVQDITSRKRAQVALRQSEERFRLLVQGVTDCALVMLDPDGTVTSWNEGATRIFGHCAEQILGRSLALLYPPDLPDDESPARQLDEARREGRCESEGWRLRSDGSRFWGHTVLRLLTDSAGGTRGFAAVTRDATERREAELALRHQALHDALTDLPNRTLLRDRLRQALASIQRDGGLAGLLLLDLDRFKEINDAFGHHIGDLMLQQVAIVLRSALRDVDTVARLGGDEFAVLLPHLAHVEDAKLVAQKILDLLADPLDVADYSLRVGASIGIALYPLHGADELDLLQRADAAMYRAKRAGGGFAVHSQGGEASFPQRLTLVRELHDAIAAGQLELRYQPELDLRTGRVLAAEALVRWAHPERGLLTADAFIPLAEETGLIRPLTRWVLGTALRQSAAWRDAGLELPVSVNLAARNLADPELPDTVIATLHATGAAPDWLVLEIPERALLAHPAGAMEVIGRLQGLGVRFSVDDCGTGAPAAASVRRLPVSELKIDRSVVIDLTASGSSPGRRADEAVRTVVDLGRTLDLRVVAEGVEDRRTCELLQSLGCEYGQGYHLAEPLRGHEVPGHLAAAARAR